MSHSSKSFWDITFLVTAEILISLLLFAAVIAVLVFLIRPHVRQYKRIDLSVFDRLRTFNTSVNNNIMLFFTLLGKPQFLIPANFALILYFAFISNHAWFSIRVVAIALSSLVLMFALKSLFNRKRPLAPLLQAAKGLSFPSGHAIMAVTFYGLLIYIILHLVKNNSLKYFLAFLMVVLILLIGFSRVYLRVHYPSDVLAGFIIGLLWLFISLAVLNKLEQHVGGKGQTANVKWETYKLLIHFIAGGSEGDGLSGCISGISGSSSGSTSGSSGVTGFSGSFSGRISGFVCGF